nr:hypothetical protein [uncultured Draconibacterium sp.]
MNFNKIKTIIFAVLAITGITACNDDDPLFNGGDNYISAFELQQNETVLKAFISGDSITIRTDENISLEGAEASVTVSENAMIEPSPSTITNWNEAQTFTVTGFNGNSKIYYYSVVHTSVTGTGNVVLTTQNEVENFAALEISELRGSLTIGASEGGGDSITSLEPLSGLKIITSGIIINSTFAGTSLDGLQNIEKVGSITIGAAPNLGVVSFPGLKSIMSELSVAGSKITELDFPALENIDNSVVLTRNDSITKINFPNLKLVGNDFTIEGGWNKMAKLSSLVLTALENVQGSLTLNYLPDLSELVLPELKTVVSLKIINIKQIETILLPKLQETFGTLYLSDLDSLVSMDLSSLVSVGGDFTFSSRSLNNLNMLKSLTSVGGTFSLYSPEITSLSGMSSLAEVNKMSISTPFSSLSDELPMLKHVKRLTVNGIDKEDFTQTVDVSNIEGLEYLSISQVNNPVIVKGPENFEGTLQLYFSNFEIEGFQNVGELNITGFNYMDESTDKKIGIRKVTGDLSVQINGINSFRFSSLEEVGGVLQVGGSMLPSFSVLKKVGELNLKIGFYANPQLSLEFPKLESVTNDCYILTSDYYGEMSDIQMPDLTAIGGLLTITGKNSSYPNTTQTNLNGFSALTAVGGVNIQYNSALTDYSGLQNAISSLSLENWETKENAYNPTYQDMIAGKFTSGD